MQLLVLKKCRLEMSDLILRLLCGCSGFISAAQMVGSNKPVAGIMFVIGSMFAVLAAVCFILLIRVCRHYGQLLIIENL